MPILFQPDDACQIRIRQALQLLGETGLPAMQSVAPGLQFLWKPVSAMVSFQRLCDGIGVRQQFTYIGPDQVFEALGRAQARRTALSNPVTINPVTRTTTQPITLYQRKAISVKYQQAKITASPDKTPQNAPRPVTLGKKKARTKTASMPP